MANGLFHQAVGFHAAEHGNSMLGLRLENKAGVQSLNQTRLTDCFGFDLRLILTLNSPRKAT